MNASVRDGDVDLGVPAVGIRPLATRQAPGTPTRSPDGPVGASKKREPPARSPAQPGDDKVLSPPHKRQDDGAGDYVDLDEAERNVDRCACGTNEGDDPEAFARRYGHTATADFLAAVRVEALAEQKAVH
jgi:hypothetical protein